MTLMVPLLGAIVCLLAALLNIPAIIEGRPIGYIAALFCALMAIFCLLVPVIK